MKRIGVITVCMLIVVAMMAPAAFAADRETKSFNVDVKVDVNNVYHVTETVDFYFGTPGHGIYRNIPTSFSEIEERVDGGWCDSDPLDTYTESGNYVLKMGDGDKYVHGLHKYKYGYDFTVRDDRDTSSDYFYFDVLPTEWETPIEQTKITVTMPKPIKEKNVYIYSGKYGSTDNEAGVSWKLEGNKKIVITGKNLEQGTGVTVGVDLPEGYWVGQYDAQEQKTYLIVFILLVALAFAAAWFKFGRRQDIVQTVEFKPPEGVTPAEIGLVIDGSLDKKDMVSMFMYYASKGYMTITEVGKKQFEFRKAQPIDENEKSFAKTLYKGLFLEGEVVNSKELSSVFGEKYRTACDKLELQYDRGRDSKSVKIQKLGAILLFIVPMIAMTFAMKYELRPESWLLGIGFGGVAAAFMAGKLRKSFRNRISGRKTGTIPVRIIYWIIDIIFTIISAVGVGIVMDSAVCAIIYGLAFLAAQYFNIYCEKLSKKAAKIMGKALGFREFIKTAELERINLMVEEDPEYFFKVLPYAYVFGLTDKWVKKFENIKIPAPEWYSSSSPVDTLTTIYLADSLSHMNRSVLHSVKKAVPDIDLGKAIDTGGSFLSGGSGGFSGGGGGFSGGGMGGGGGGSW